MDNKNWKKKYKPSACTRAPWEFLIPVRERKGIMRQINQETIDLYGYSMEECPKRLVCLKKECMGRPLPWLSDTARPYLEKLKETQELVNDELIVKTDCSECPLFKDCKAPCFQVMDFIQRDKVKEPLLYYKAKHSTLDAINEREPTVEHSSEPLDLLFNGDDIPWDCLTDKKQSLIKKYLYDQLDFKYIADQLNLNNQARCKREFYYALTRLSEYAIMRKFLNAEGKELSDKQWILLHEVYRNNKTFTKVAEELQVSVQNVQQIIQRVVTKHKLKWPKFVQKKGEKIIYNVPELFK